MRGFNNLFLVLFDAESLGILKDYPHSAFPLEKKTIKTEPEDPR